MRYLIIAFLLFSFDVYADDSYAVQRPDGGVSIVTHFSGTTDSLADVIKDMGFEGYPVIRIEQSDLPDREDREFWEFNDVPIGKKLRVNTAKKAIRETEINDRRAKRTSARNKICPSCTEDDWKDALNAT